MAVIYLRHERHGDKVACSEMEAQYDETNGWVRYTLDAPAPVADEPVDAPVDVPNFLAARGRRKGAQGA